MPACRSPIGCICRRNGPKTRPAARKRVFRERSRSRPSRRSRLGKSARLRQRGCQVALLMDASYGSNRALRDGVRALGFSYVAAIVPTVKVRKVSEGLGSRMSVKQLALSLPKHAWRTITWREAVALCPRLGAGLADEGT